MKKKFLILFGAFIVILAYMLVIWFCVPTEKYTDFFATEQIMRVIAPLSPLFLIRSVYLTQLVVIFLFFCLSLLLFKKLNKITTMIFSLALPSVCSFLLNVFLIKPRVIGIGTDAYAPHTLLQNHPAFVFNVTAFDILFALLIGIITALFVMLAVKWYGVFAPHLVTNTKK